jgi:integrase
MAGATIKEIQELAGHKTITMSARYAHLSPEHKLSVVERIIADPAKKSRARKGAMQNQTGTRTGTR